MIRLVEERDVDAVVALVHELAAYERAPEHCHLTAAQRRLSSTQAALAAAQRLDAQGRGLFDTWVIQGPGGAVVGRANIQNIVRGTMQGGTLGYWVDRDHLGRGVARGAVSELVPQEVRELRPLPRAYGFPSGPGVTPLPMRARTPARQTRATRATRA